MNLFKNRILAVFVLFVFSSSCNQLTTDNSQNSMEATTFPKDFLTVEDSLPVDDLETIDSLGVKN